MPENLWHIHPIYATMFAAVQEGSGCGCRKLENQEKTERPESETEAAAVMSGVVCTHYKEYGQIPADTELEKLAKMVFTKIRREGWAYPRKPPLMCYVQTGQIYGEI